MSIVTQTKNVMINAIKRYAEINETENTKTQILICTDNPECLPTYKICKNFKPINEVSFNELLNKKIDFLGREQIATPFIKNCLKRITNEQKCNYDHVNVLIYGKNNEVDDVDICLFIETKPVKHLTLDYIFGEDI